MNHILSLIENQIAMANFRDRTEKIAPQPGRYVGEDGVAFGPCLLISRECGSGSAALAQMAGERLGWNVFDAKIVDEIAQVARIQQRLVNSVDERVHSYWEQTWREMLLEDLADDKYFQHLKQIVTALGHQGNVVIVGRGAQYFLPPQCALRVRLVAPLEERAKRVAGLSGLTVEMARSKAVRIDGERAGFIRKIFKQDSSLSVNYDLTINTGQIEIESATELVLSALEKKLGVRLKKAGG
jgi:cytidylate kinase